MTKTIIWFSCGATSAIAAKMAVNNLKDHDIRVIYCDTRSEHEDNMRFLKDVEKWIGHPIESMGSKDYEDIWDVFEKTGWLVGVNGARCSTELKKKVRQEVEKEWHPDYQVFGFDAGEKPRATLFRKNNPEVNLITPLIDDGGFDWCQDIKKETCLGILSEAGIEIPAMYRLGYNNANCLGCVKGFSGYWNHVRRVHPQIFDRMAAVERAKDTTIIHKKIKVSLEDAIDEINEKLNDKDLAKIAINELKVDGKTKVKKETYKLDEGRVTIRRRVFLDELDPEAGRHKPMEKMSCDLLCGNIYDEVIENGEED